MGPTTPRTAEELVAEHLARRPDVDLVTDWLATGGDLHPHDEVARTDLEAIVALGVTHVLDVRSEWTDEAFVATHAPDVRYVHLGVDDAGQRLAASWFEAGIAVAREVRARPGARLLAHCHMGVNRGPSMAYALLLDDGWDPVEGLEAIRAARPVAAVGYAADALDHHHDRTGADDEQRAHDRARVAAWFRDNRIDVATIVRGIRAAEGTTFR